MPLLCIEVLTPLAQEVDDGKDEDQPEAGNEGKQDEDVSVVSIYTCKWTHR